MPRAGQVVQAKVAISFVSMAQARATMDQEAPGWNFDQVRAAAHDTWNQALSKIVLQGASESNASRFTPRSTTPC